MDLGFSDTTAIFGLLIVVCVLVVVGEGTRTICDWWRSTPEKRS